MKIHKFNEISESIRVFDIKDFKFIETNASDEDNLYNYSFDYKNGEITGDFKITSYMGYPHCSAINITKGENKLTDQDMVDLEIFIEEYMLTTDLNEDSATGGPASAGMGAVVSAQPSSNPGATIGADTLTVSPSVVNCLIDIPTMWGMTSSTCHSKSVGGEFLG